MKVFGFFSGIGGFELGFERAGFEVVSVCEIDPFCNKVLAKHFPKATNLGDIQSLSAASLAKICPSLVAKPDSTASVLDSTGNICDSSLDAALTGLLQKMSDTLGDDGCPNCGEHFSHTDMPACRFECAPLTWERHTNARASSLLPTPTASSYGSCRGGGSGRVGKWRPSLLALGIRDPDDWEAMMGFPRQWTDVAPSETQSSRKSRKSSRAG
jgi:hypothetical protein